MKHALGIFDGTLSGTLIKGTWKFDSGLYSVAGAPMFQGPMQLDLTQSAGPPQ